MQGNSSGAVLSLTRHQFSIHCESSRVAHGASNWRWAPQTTRDTPNSNVYAKKQSRRVRCFCAEELAMIMHFSDLCKDKITQVSKETVVKQERHTLY